jgi:rhodanese-related sulfurtransferase
VKNVALEAVAVALGGFLLALLFNAASPRGIRLTRNYFPATKPVAVSTTGTNLAAVAHATTNTLSARLAAKGFQVADTNLVLKLYHDPGYSGGGIVFLDARNDQAYTAGHIPGAYQLDYYYKEKYLPTVLPVLMSAVTIVVYCNGGECEDSELTASLLLQAGIPPSRIFVYAGGFSEWEAVGLPVELQTRHSGITKGKP